LVVMVVALLVGAFGGRVGGHCDGLMVRRGM
jgi:hypothetical protein